MRDMRTSKPNDAIRNGYFAHQNATKSCTHTHTHCRIVVVCKRYIEAFTECSFECILFWSSVACRWLPTGVNEFDFWRLCSMEAMPAGSINCARARQSCGEIYSVFYCQTTVQRRFFINFLRLPSILLTRANYPTLSTRLQTNPERSSFSCFGCIKNVNDNRDFNEKLLNFIIKLFIFIWYSCALYMWQFLVVVRSIRCSIWHMHKMEEPLRNPHDFIPCAR